MNLTETLQANLTARITFPLSNYLFNRRHIGRQRRDLQRSQFYPEEQQREFQWQKARRVIAFAYRWVPFYHQRFRQVGMEPGDIKSLEDMVRLPPVTREDLLQHHHEMVDFRRAGAVHAADERPGDQLGKPIALARFRGANLVKNTSSGSSGSPVTYYEDGSTSAASWAYEQLFKGWFQVPPGAREVRLFRLSSEHMPSQGQARLRRLLWRQVVLPGLNLSARDYDTCLDTIRSFQPEILWGFASALQGLAAHLEETRQTLRDARPRLVVTWAEPLYPEEEALLLRVLECPVTNLYSSHEVGHIACRCPHGSFHVNQTHLLLETDPPQGPDHDGSGPGELLATTLFDSPMPFIRYRLGDVGQLQPSRCPCGRSLQVLSSFLGRTYELHRTRDGRMISPNFWLHLLRRDHVAGFVKQFQVTYLRDGGIQVRVVRKPGHPLNTEPALRELISRNLDPETHLEWIYTERIEPEPSGKCPLVKRER